ncbi:ABC transporter permease [Cytophagaceae bacterium ABcell3]|nr:ABC transporter permease [Cytophagaceae bacterium ABcell3]
MGRNKDIKSPSWYVRRRLMKNKPALFGLFVIVLAHVIAILGYLLMPDQTPNANDGSALIKKKNLGFEVDILKSRKPREIKKVNFLTKMFVGQESEYVLLPVSDWKVKDLKVYYSRYGRETEVDSADLPSMVLPLYSGFSEKFPHDGKYNYKVDEKEGVIHYLDYSEEVRQISKSALLADFKDNNYERRRYLLGTDKSGRDILSRLLFGTRISLSIGFISVLISIFVGMSLGAIAGFFGGKLDNIIMWLMTVVWSIPGIMLVIAISLALQSKGVWVAFVAVGLTMWVEVARVVRGQIMGIKEKQFVEAARALGISNMHIIFKHILPNILGPLIVIATANFASAILIEAGLSFLGLGVQPPMPSWGMMVYEGYTSIGSKNSGYLVILPSVAISALVLAFNLFGNGLRDAYDPKTSVKW